MRYDDVFAIINRKLRADRVNLPNLEDFHMRGIPSLITDIRKKVFTEVARMAYNGDDYRGCRPDRCN